VVSGFSRTVTVRLKADTTYTHGMPFASTVAVAIALAVVPREASIDAEIREVAALAGEPHVVSAAGVTRDETPILTIENPDAFDTASGKRRLVLVGGGSRAADVVALVRWFKTRAPRPLRVQWAVSALPAASFEPEDTQSLARWITFQAPDLVVTVGHDPLQAPMASTALGVGDTIPALRKLMLLPRERSPLHSTLVARVGRGALDIARVLAQRYPETPAISYIPALAWSVRLKLAAMLNDEAMRGSVEQEVRPWLAGEKTLPGDRVQLTSVAGTLIFADIAAASGSAAGDRAAATRLFEEGVAVASAERAPGAPAHGQGWTDDMFMAAAVLARSGARPGHEADLDVAARLLVAYAARLQQPGGLFHHAVDGPAAWGRGNGFAAFGLIETLMRMPPAHPSYAKLLEIYRRHMAAVREWQAPDGTWRQIIDAPGAYREETATAMLTTAMARGVRLGWIDRSYLPAVQRGWRALAAHITEDGGVVDVCSSTGAGPTRRYYFDRPAVTGRDDRGGAMALVAAFEMHELGNIWKSGPH
jgi:unsaturated rhamnogalacturonyl hydrolase